MAKEIVRTDIPLVKALLLQVVGSGEYATLTRMGGLTNHTYKAAMPDGSEYVVRLPGEGTEEMIRRSDEKKSTTLACELGIDARMLYFGDDGSKVTEYIKNAETMSAQTICSETHLQQVAQVLKKLHTCGADTGVPFEVFDMAAGYEKIVSDCAVPMFEDYAAVKAQVEAVKAEIDRVFPAKKVPCHNDPLCENWVVGDGKMYLIDWEYAGMNDGMWDVADVSIEAELTARQDSYLLGAYLGHPADLFEQKHFLASKIYVDFLWTLWAKARVPYDGQPMEDWAAQRYSRLKGFLAQYNAL